MRILHVIASLEMGGAQKLLTELLPLQAAAESVDLLVYKRENNEIEKAIESAGIRIVSLDVYNLYSSFIIFRLRKIFKEYDVVHAHLFPSTYWVSLAARGLKVKLVYTEHSTSNSRRNKWYFLPIERFMYSRFDRIISISQQTQDALTSWLRQSDERFVVINNGINTQRFASVKLSVIPKSLIMVSRFVPSKDQETVIRAMKLLDADVILYLVGDGVNRTHCEDLAKGLGLSERVLFLGPRSDVPELVASSYIGIQSSNWEGFGLTAVELMAAGKPVVASDVDGLKQVVEGAGIVFKKGSPEDLAEKITHLLNDSSLYDVVSRKCVKRSLLYEIKTMAKKYNEVYCELVKS